MKGTGRSWRRCCVGTDEEGLGALSMVGVAGRNPAGEGKVALLTAMTTTTTAWCATPQGNEEGDHFWSHDVDAHIG